MKPHVAVYYPPDGTGRDTYVIKNHGGTCIEDCKSPNINFRDNTFLRDNKNAPFGTPNIDRKLMMMTAPQMQTYNNWPSRTDVIRNRDLYLK